MVNRGSCDYFSNNDVMEYDILFIGPSRKAMDQLRNLSETGTGGKGEGGRGGGSSPRSLTEAFFPLPTKSEEKIGAERLGDLAHLVDFDTESTMVVSLSPSPLSHSLPLSLTLPHVFVCVVNVE